MKIYLILTLAGLAISFALPSFAQEKGAAVDPQIVQQLHAIGKKSDEAFLKGDNSLLHLNRGLPGSPVYDLSTVRHPASGLREERHVTVTALT